jgi:hypothetical protein
LLPLIYEEKNENKKKSAQQKKHTLEPRTLENEEKGSRVVFIETIEWF